jgi:ABC-2 type transport system permease protein
MRNIWTIASREFKHYFISPIAYAVFFMILVILGVIFYANILAAISGAYSQYVPGIQIVVGPLVTLLLFTTPAITMRSIADERRSGTLELLLTAPIRDWELIVGKWLGSFLFVLSIVVVTWVYPIILNQLVQPGIDQGLLVTNYLGLALLISSYIAIGIATSSFFSNPIASFFATLGILLLLWMIGYPAQAMGATGGKLLSYFDLSSHFYNSFYQGVIDLKDIIYYISVTGLALFLGKISIEVRRWR